MQKLAAFCVILGFLLSAGACSLQGDSARTSLYEVSVTGDDPTILLASPGNAYLGPAWSADGKRLAFTMSPLGAKAGQLYVADTDGSGLMQLTNHGRNKYLPAWSPDGQVICTISQEGDTRTAEIYTIRLDSRTETRLTHNDAWEYGMSWSPDGTQIVFG